MNPLRVRTPIAPHVVKLDDKLGSISLVRSAGSGLVLRHTLNVLSVGKSAITHAFIGSSKSSYRTRANVAGSPILRRSTFTTRTRRLRGSASPPPYGRNLEPSSSKRFSDVRFFARTVTEFITTSKATVTFTPRRTNEAPRTAHLARSPGSTRRRRRRWARPRTARRASLHLRPRRRRCHR